MKSHTVRLFWTASSPYPPGVRAACSNNSVRNQRPGIAGLGAGPPIGGAPPGIGAGLGPPIGAGEGAVPGAGALAEEAPPPLFAIAPTREAPINIAPSSIASVPAAMSPVSRAFDFSSHRSETVIFPSTSPNTVTDLVLISPRTCAFSPTVKFPSETTSPSIFPSMIRSCENFKFPTISTSLDSIFLLVLMRFEWWEGIGDWDTGFIDWIGPGPSASAGLGSLPDPVGSWLMICLSTVQLTKVPT